MYNPKNTAQLNAVDAWPDGKDNLPFSISIASPVQAPRTGRHRAKKSGRRRPANSFTESVNRLTKT
jgi:hypothetical protein